MGVPSRSFDKWRLIMPAFAKGFGAAAFASSLRFEAKAGRGERIWTSDFLLPKQARFQAAPRPDVGIFLSRIDWLCKVIT